MIKKHQKISMSHEKVDHCKYFYEKQIYLSEAIKYIKFKITFQKKTFINLFEKKKKKKKREKKKKKNCN